MKVQHNHSRSGPGDDLNPKQWCDDVLGTNMEIGNKMLRTVLLSAGGQCCQVQDNTLNLPRQRSPLTYLGRGQSSPLLYE